MYTNDTAIASDDIHRQLFSDRVVDCDGKKVNINSIGAGKSDLGHRNVDNRL